MGPLAEILKIGGTRRRWVSGRWVQRIYVILDVFSVSASALAIFYLRFASGVPPASLRHYAGFLVIYAVFILLFFQSYDLYRTPRGKPWLDEGLAVFRGVSLATLVVVIFIYLSGVETISRMVVLANWGLNIGTLSAWRYFKRRFVEQRVAKGHGVRNVLIVGAGKVGQRLAHILQENRHLGLTVKGFLGEGQEGDGILGRAEELPQVLQKHFIEDIFITVPSEQGLLTRIAVEARKHRASVKVIPELLDETISGGHLSLEFLGDLPVLELYRKPIPELGLLIKRAMDIVGGFVGLAITAPLTMAIAAAIKLDDGGPILYRSQRMGRKGRIFPCYKFRTMIPNADELKDQLRSLNERQGPFFKITNDPRLTRVGGLLRKYSLDEIPQFFNVLVGDMSLVGPRPHPLDDFQQYKLPHYRRLDVTPGMTSLWAVGSQDDPSFDRTLELDLHYIEHWSLWLDIKILAKTIPTVLRGIGR